MGNLKIVVPVVLGLSLLGFLGTKFLSPKEKAAHKEAAHAHEEKSGEKHDDHDEHAEAKEPEKDDHGDEHAHKEGEKDEHNDDHAHKDGEDDHKDEHKDDHAAKEEGHGDEHGHDEGGSDFGEGKAIVAVKNDGKQFQLSEESSKFLGVTTEPLKVVSPGTVSIKRDLLVEYMSDVGIFIKNGVWIELKKAQVVSETAEFLTLKVSDLKSGDQLITAPLRTLRAAHLVASGEGGKGHAH